MALVYSWEQRIEKVDSVIAAMQSVKDTFRAAQRYEKQQKKDLLDVALMVTRINTMLSGVSTTLSAAVEDVLAELIANNPGVWQIDIGPEDFALITTANRNYEMAIDVNVAGDFTSYVISDDLALSGANAVANIFGSFATGDIVEVYNAEDDGNNLLYLVETGSTAYVFETNAASGCVFPQVANGDDRKIRFKLKER